MRDLTIRGAGDLLGSEQSGFIDTVGIDMYIEMLEEAIAKQKGETVEVKETPKHAMVSGNSYIPKQFAPDDFDKISMYQTIDAAASLPELEDYKEQVSDQYGQLPEEVRRLFDKKTLDILLNGEDVQGYKEVRDVCEVTFTPEFSQKVDGVKLFEIFSKISKDIQLRYRNQCITASVPKIKDSLGIVITIIERAQEAVRK